MEHDHLNNEKLIFKENANVDPSAVRSIQIRCVLKVILDSIECVKSALFLPKLLKYPNNVPKVLYGTIYHPAIQLVEDYIRRRDIMVRERLAPLTDMGMIRLIDYFQKHPGIYKLFPSFSMTPHDRKLLLVFEHLYKIAKHHLLRSSKKEINTERILHKVFQQNLKYRENIKQLEIQLGKQMVQLRWKLTSKNALLNKYELQIQAERKANIERIRQESERCQRLINENLRNNQEKQKLLEDERQALATQYKIQSAEQQRDEKRAREEKNKLELQLEDALRRYDRVIGAKIIEHFDAENDLNKEKQELEQFMIIYRKEEAIYNDIVVARDKEEEKRKQYAIKMYMMNRAARKIQTYWRKWRKNLKKIARREQQFIFGPKKKTLDKRKVRSKKKT